MKPKISIIIPVYNVEESIYATFKSILNQTFENIEVITIDDGSVDNTPRILKKYTKLDSRIKLLKTNAEGEAVAQNLGLKEAHGKYIMFFKCGNLMSSNLLEYFFPIMENYEYKILTCDYFTIPELAFHDYFHMKSPKQKKENLTPISSTQYFQNLSSRNNHVFQNTCVLWNKLIDKTLLTNFEFDTAKQIPNPFAIQKLLTSEFPMLVSNQKLIASAQIDLYYEQISFNYNELEKIEFLQNLLVFFKKNNNTLAIKNISIKLLDLLYKIRIKLNNYHLEIYDLEEQKKNINQKFSSVRKFLKKYYPNNKSEYSYYFDKYKQILDTENFVSNHIALYPNPPKKFQLINDDYYLKTDELS